ncbi:hypothetical protein FOL47_006449 [Perkinsus chesapeaki]|uniref:Uncharacterized protein n=1 Tax=Perkinsus chesapeaki TaxID=330153 RepID=A0A7J6MXL6_PERCH|nr:hypothetical protein FOL47_006449 [Perkinsus chesapeaki]
MASVPGIDNKTVVAVHSFDPATVSWPFKREGQRLMRLFAGDYVEVINGPDNADWWLGRLAHNPTRTGYFPRNFAVTIAEYQEMKEGGEIDERNEKTEQEHRRDFDMNPELNVDDPSVGDDSSVGEDKDEEESEATGQIYVKDYAGMGKAVPRPNPQFPPLSSKPPVATAFAPGKSKMLKSMPGIPKHHQHHHPVAETILEEEGEGGDDEEEEEKEEEEEGSELYSGDGSAISGVSDAGPGGSAAGLTGHRALRRDSTSDDTVRPPMIDISATAGRGKVSESRISTPATYALGRPERDFIRANMPPGMQSHIFRDVTDIADLVLDVTEDSGLAGPADSRATALARRALMDAYGSSSMVSDEAATTVSGPPGSTRTGGDGGGGTTAFSASQATKSEGEKTSTEDGWGTSDWTDIAYRGRQDSLFDGRIRASTCRVAAGIEPTHMRLAIERARERGQRWTHMFRPGLNDITNESLKMGRDPCVLSNLYLYDYATREQFMRQHIRDQNGTMWFELQRKKPHLFYMRLEFVDVMMFHPDAWGLPDAGNVVMGNAGEPYDPFHGWFHQVASNADREFTDVQFSYATRIRIVPPETFSTMALGKLPDWLQPYTELQADLSESADLIKQLQDGSEDDDNITRAMVGDNDGILRGRVELTMQNLLEAGLVDEEEVYVHVDDLRRASNESRFLAPDVLGVEEERYSLTGLNGLRLLLRATGNPDGTKGHVVITPKQIKSMAMQLGIHGNYHYYWYCYFALKYNLPPDWEVIIRGSDVRYYVKLDRGGAGAFAGAGRRTDESSRLAMDQGQVCHPMLEAFREHLNDCILNDFLWDYRGFLKVKCSECGVLDSVVWCQQCTDNFCCDCYGTVHKRRKSHWAYPLPGCRYLTKAEAAMFSDALPFVNVGFCNRRRFLARDNQSDKTGPCQCQWLFFPREAFEAALQQCPADHWHLARLNPPRLAPDADGFYYSFAHDVITDDPAYIHQKSAEQTALLKLQKFIRGALVRKRVRRQTDAVTMIASCKRMWDAQRFFGRHGSNAMILRSWYRKFRARADYQLTHQRISKVQATFRGMAERRRLMVKHMKAAKIQSYWRMKLTQKALADMNRVATDIQRVLRGYWYGRKPVRDMQEKAATIQGILRGVLVRARMQRQLKTVLRVQALVKGFLDRTALRRRVAAATRIQSCWRRWQASLEVKVMLFGELEAMEEERKRLMRTKLANLAALLLQRNLRRNLNKRLAVLMRRTRATTEKQVNTVVGQVMLALMGINNYIHPWWRHLPPAVSMQLRDLKAHLQRAIANVPIEACELLASEMFFGKKERFKDKMKAVEGKAGGGGRSDMAAEILLTVTKETLNMAGGQLTVGRLKDITTWTAYSMGHCAVALDRAMPEGAFSREFVELSDVPGRGTCSVPCRAKEPMMVLWKDMASLKHSHDRRMRISEENFWLLTMKGLPQKVLNVTLIAETLITLREFLDQPRLQMDSNLSFQGVDATAAQQIFDLIGCEIEHRLPEDWPINYGKKTAHVVVQELLRHVKKIEPPSIKKVAERKKARRFAYLTRRQVLRCVQNLGVMLRNVPVDVTTTTSRTLEIQRLRELFALSRRNEYQEHTPFVLGVVVIHLTLRALLARVMRHRAAIVIQTQYRYYKVITYTNRIKGPVLRMQRSWRALKAALQLVRQNTAAVTIQHNYRSVVTKRRNAALMRAVLRLQSIFRTKIHQRWINHLNTRAVLIQRFFRGHLVRSSLHGEGSDIVRRYKKALRDLAEERLRNKDTFPFYMYLVRRSYMLCQYRNAVEEHRDDVVDIKRMKARQKMMKLEQYRLHAIAKEETESKVQRLSCYEPPAFARRRVQQIRPRLALEKTSIQTVCESIHRNLAAVYPRAGAAHDEKGVHSAIRRGQMALASRKLKDSSAKDSEQSVMDDEGPAQKHSIPVASALPSDQWSAWLQLHFESSIPWMPKTVCGGIMQAEFQTDREVVFLYATAYMFGFLCRTDDTRPPWSHRLPMIHDHSKALLSGANSFGEHIAAVTRVIASKLAADSEVKSCFHGVAVDPWKKAVVNAATLWRSIFTYIVSSNHQSDRAIVLFMAACEAALVACKASLSTLWRSTNDQFTTRVAGGGKYRGLKHRPHWAVADRAMYNGILDRGHLGLDYGQRPTRDAVASHEHLFETANGSGSFSKQKAARLDDFINDVISLRFAIDWLHECIDQGTQALETMNKRKAKAQLESISAAHASRRRKGDAEQPHQQDGNFTWSDDGELRGVMGVSSKLIDIVCGSSASPLLHGACVSGHLLVAVWKGIEPMVSTLTQRYVNNVTLGAGQHYLPPPGLELVDAGRIPAGTRPNGYHSRGYHWIAESYTKPSQAFTSYTARVPNVTIGLVSRVQGLYRGFIMRHRYVTSVRAVAHFSKLASWPPSHNKARKATSSESRGPETARSARSAYTTDGRSKGRSKAAFDDDKAVETFKPTVSPYLGGKTQAKTTGSRNADDRPVRSSRVVKVQTANSASLPDIIQADHAACANLYFLYVYNMWLAGEMIRVWQWLSWSYEKVMDRFATLLQRNPNLKPMVESIAAQLKQRQLVHSQSRDAAAHNPAPPSGKKGGKQLEKRHSRKGEDAFLSRPVPASSNPRGGSSVSDIISMPSLKVQRGQSSVDDVTAAANAGLPDQANVDKEYMKKYLIDMDGDDSQFKDIDANVLPISTGGPDSPKRVDPEEVLLRDIGGPSNDPRGNPKVTIEFCVGKLQPVWLGIKPVRFRLCRTKLLQTLKSPEIATHFVNQEKQGNYLACIMLLEDTSIGNLNVFNPATLSPNQPFMTETVMQVIAGFIGICVKNEQLDKAASLVQQTIEKMPAALRDLHATHKSVVEAYIFDTALGVAFAAAKVDPKLLGDRAEFYFQQASARYQRMGHVCRYAKCCLRYACVLFRQGHFHEAEYFCSRAVQEMTANSETSKASSLLATAFINRAISAATQKQVMEADTHLKNGMALLRHLPKLKAENLQAFDNTVWLIRKLKELWPSNQHKFVQRN